MLGMPSRRAGDLQVEVGDLGDRLSTARGGFLGRHLSAPDRTSFSARVARGVSDAGFTMAPLRTALQYH